MGEDPLDGGWVCMLERTISITKLCGVEGVAMVADVEHGTQVVANRPEFDFG
ncbi:hypothetical protein P691DRAFT_801249 [Macrolepiota fuliginosa MF-IS2]|uniref:Uncharacterized protein n=1 Tax=Macrolepiota fuliginosa MF-IS2 TaxID=1400762 RepID=A0A9P5WYG8_9AGAR|nr:hypothetical protein P691DRAFT_801249 [Macrolepiota fuliginosa MF-IS2]